MGDRFYQQQLAATGTCPGFIGKRRKRVSWDDEKRAAVVAAYEEAEPTPETSMEIVSAIAEEFGESPNGVRMVLTKAGVYIKKEVSAVSGGSKGSGGGGTRVSKADQQKALEEAISAHGAEVDTEITSKLTGKAAAYLAGVLNSIES